MSRETESPSETVPDVEVELSGGEALPLVALDRAIGPLRRTAAYAVRRPNDGVRYLEVNGSRWIGAALHLDLPSPIRDALAAIGGRLVGFDHASGADRKERLRQIHQQITRLDAVLGLPLHAPIRRHAKARREEPASEPVDEVKKAPPRSGRGRKDRGRGKERDEGAAAYDAASEVEATPSAGRGHRLGDPALTGRPLSELGCDPSFVAKLAAHGIHTLVDLLWTPPVDEEVLRPLHGAGRPIPAGRAAVGGRVRSRATVLGPDGSRRARFSIQGAGPLDILCASPTPAWLAQRLTPGTRVVFVGRYVPGEPDGEEVERGGVLHDAEWVFADGHHAAHLARYGLDGVPDSAIRAEILRLAPLLDGLRDPLAVARAAALGLPSLADALRLAHQTVSANPEARKRLALDECVTAFLGLAPRGELRQRGIAHPIGHGLVARLGRVYEHQLSDPSQAALEAIKRDLRSSLPMVRLLTGEIATGPCSVALLTAVLVAESKSQVLSIATDRATAEARFLFAEPYLREVGLVARLLDDAPSKAQRDALRRGEVHIAFATAAALGAELEFRRLGLVIAEEDTTPRAALTELQRWRTPRPDLLVVASAPVPTVAFLRSYADHTLTEVVGALEGEQGAEVLGAAERMSAYQKAAAQVAAGAQAWVVFPMVRGHDALDAREVARLRATLAEQVFPGARIGVFHGAMSREDRLRTYEDFVHRRYDVLVATSIFEEGLPVPGGTVAVIEQADKLTLRRAARIRGHLARGDAGARAYFILADDADEASAERLRVACAAPAYAPVAVEDVSDVVWPEDGPSMPNLRWTRPARDRAIVMAAQALVADLIAEDPALRSGPASELAQGGRALWTRLFDGPDPIPALAPEANSGRRRRRRRKRK